MSSGKCKKITMPRTEGHTNALNHVSGASSLTMPHLPTRSVALMNSFPTGVSNLHAKKYLKKIKRQWLP